MAIDRIFLDVDGVLANWEGAVCRLFDTDPQILKDDRGDEYDICSVLGCSTNELWRRVDQAGEDFWANLEPFPWTLALWECCESIAPTTILTSPSYHPSSLGGKLRWLNQHLAGGNNFREFLIGPAKVACSRQYTVLIDDRDVNCVDFKKYGGAAIMFPRPWNSARGFVGQELDFVKQALRTMTHG